jgi:hypothetical protein
MLLLLGFLFLLLRLAFGVEGAGARMEGLGVLYRSTSLVSICNPLGPCSRTIHRDPAVGLFIGPYAGARIEGYRQRKS